MCKHKKARKFLNVSHHFRRLKSYSETFRELFLWILIIHAPGCVNLFEGAREMSEDGFAERLKISDPSKLRRRFRWRRHFLRPQLHAPADSPRGRYVFPFWRRASSKSREVWLLPHPESRYTSKIDAIFIKKKPVRKINEKKTTRIPFDSPTRERSTSIIIFISISDYRKNFL